MGKSNAKSKGKSKGKQGKKPRVDKDSQIAALEKELEALDDRYAELCEILEELKEVETVPVPDDIPEFDWNARDDVGAAFAEFNDLIPEDTDESERREFHMSFNQLTPDQKGIFFELIKHQALTEDRIPEQHVLYKLPRVEWVRIIIKLAGQMKEAFGECDCLGRAKNKSRPYVVFKDKNEKGRQTRSARIVCGIVHGFDCLVGRQASHLCGNCNCLFSIHLRPEPESKNLARITHHKNGLTDCDCQPQCLPSLKAWGKSSVDVGWVPFKHTTRILTTANYVRNRKGTQNIQLDDREYSLKDSSAGRYNCNQLGGCPGYITVIGSGDSKEAILVRDHKDECKTLSEKENEWIAKSVPLTEVTYFAPTKGEHKGQMVNIDLNGYRYSLNDRGKHVCTTPNCYGSLTVKDGRAGIDNPHKSFCDENALETIKMRAKRAEEAKKDKSDGK